MKTQTHYPTPALTALIYFLNSCLPYPKKGTDYMIGIMEELTEGFLKEVRSAVETLPPEALPGYAKEIDRKMSDFNCIYGEAYFDPITEDHKVIELHPPLDMLLLNDQNPDFRDLKHKLCHKTLTYQNRVVKYLDEKVGELHPALQKGR